LHEGDKPYIIKVLEDGDLETVGREDYGTLADRLTAHPKIDPVTGEMFAFYWKQVELPYLTYQMFSKEGVLLEPVPITIPERVFIHDFAITENYAIFLDLSLMMNGKVCNIYQHEH
jgi:carotenoid cleavage dioxygenase-like enzyme